MRNIAIVLAVIVMGLAAQAILVPSPPVDAEIVTGALPWGLSVDDIQAHVDVSSLPVQEAPSP